MSADPAPREAIHVNIERILCPIDFSDASRHAVDQAVVFAGWYKARMTVLHVRGATLGPAATLPVAGARHATDSETDALRKEAAAHCAAAASAGIALDIVIDVGQPASQIVERAKSLPADLIAMATHGTSGLEHLVLGSVTEKVLRKAPCPVVTVPPHAAGTAVLPFQRLLCAVDFSDSSLKALQYAFSLAEESKASLTILHVLEWPWQEPPPPAMSDLPAAQAAALTEYRRYCEESATTRLRSLVPATFSASQATTRINHGKPYVETLRVAAEERPDLIVLGAHGHNPLELSVFGSTANQVVRRATCPVLTVR